MQWRLLLRCLCGLLAGCGISSGDHVLWIAFLADSVQPVLRLGERGLLEHGLQKPLLGRSDFAAFVQNQSDVVVSFCFANGLNKMRFRRGDVALSSERQCHAVA